MNLVFTAVAAPELGIDDRESSRKVRNYHINAFISLLSAKIYGHSHKVALITNVFLESDLLELFNANGIEVHYVKFSKFVFPSNFKWSLAFYKLCALDYVVNNFVYSQYLMIDADTFSLKTFIDIWEESREGILLFNTNHVLSHKVRQEIINDSISLGLSNKQIPQYGGEFICGSRSDLVEFTDRCLNIFNTISRDMFNISQNSGDELIISIAAKDFNIRNANPYINRYWTGYFYKVSTDYFYDGVSIIHVPDEKRSGLIAIYVYFCLFRNLPRLPIVYRLLSLPPLKKRVSSKGLLVKLALIIYEKKRRKGK